MTEITLDVYTSPLRELPKGGFFSPTTSTLIMGPTEAILVDTQYMPEDVDEVIRRIESSGRALTAIYITHGHSDHYFGLQRLLERYPGAAAVTHPSVAAKIQETLDGDRAFSREFFAGAAADNTAVPEALDSGELFVDGELVLVVELDQADTAPTTALHIPVIDAVIAGDVVYNQVHLFLAASSPAEWAKWIDSVDAIAALNPRVLVAGHKRPELPDTNVRGMIESTRAYLEAFIDGLSRFEGSRELVTHMQELFPDYENKSTLVASAIVAFKQKSRQALRQD